MNEWTDTPLNIEDFQGFVYYIEHIPTGRKYIGKKNFWSIKTLPPLKGKKKKRKVRKESDWRDYYSSCKEILDIIEKEGKENFFRRMIHLCKSKSEMSYLEAEEQFTRRVLLKDDYFNGIINCRINRKHVRNLLP